MENEIFFMENEIKIEGQKNHQIGQNQTNQSPIFSVLEKSKLNYWMIF